MKFESLNIQTSSYSKIDCWDSKDIISVLLCFHKTTLNYLINAYLFIRLKYWAPSFDKSYQSLVFCCIYYVQCTYSIHTTYVLCIPIKVWKRWKIGFLHLSKTEKNTTRVLAVKLGTYWYRGKCFTCQRWQVGWWKSKCQPT